MQGKLTAFVLCEVVIQRHLSRNVGDGSVQLPAMCAQFGTNQQRNLAVQASVNAIAEPLQCNGASNETTGRGDLTFRRWHAQQQGATIAHRQAQGSAQQAPHMSVSHCRVCWPYLWLSTGDPSMQRHIALGRLWNSRFADCL